MVNLTDLPAEILHGILFSIENARELVRFQLTCRKFHQLVLKDGFRIFAQSRFPSIAPSIISKGVDVENGFWRDAAHGLTTLSRNWDRKAFIAQDTGPNQGAPISPRQRSRQTMGFLPVIDSFEAWLGNDWRSRKQTVTWGAGPRLVLGSRDLRDQETKWATYDEEGTRDGRDDITCVKLLRSASSESQSLLLGRANGDLAIVSFDSESSQFKHCARFITQGYPIKSATVSLDGHIAACTSRNILSFYSSPFETSEVTSDSRIEIKKPGKIWVTHFLRHNRLAVGFGPSSEPIKVLNLDRDVEQGPQNASRYISTRTRSDAATSKATSVYSLTPLPASSLAGGLSGDLFLSGGHDGIIRLHDLRSAHSTVASFEDSIDYSPVYSLLPFGRERFVAGAAENSLIKVFDLRLPGGKRYYATNLQTCSADFDDRQNKLDIRSHCHHVHRNIKDKRRGWNVFIGQRILAKNWRRKNASMPVYSLSKPSEYSPTFFAGMEDRVVQFDLVSIMDSHPDPIYGEVVGSNRHTHDIQRKWNPHRRVFSFPMYEHPDANASVHMRLQRDVEYYETSCSHWDERWI